MQIETLEVIIGVLAVVAVIGWMFAIGIAAQNVEMENAGKAVYYSNCQRPDLSASDRENLDRLGKALRVK